ncbi:transient receptor potential cation channel subfamily M member-like 2 [Crassostrea angulata]|uniref:transient receptor potential cation channel subfamily M member-like 2 n=1 Tax=Magallana angulata TaxID=2784310 RepID=UPI0022B110F7|nr:transient receptor potential cation channel subfamily M member-like 2 [Crassostrea angulata]
MSDSGKNMLSTESLSTSGVRMNRDSTAVKSAWDAIKKGVNKGKDERDTNEIVQSSPTMVFSVIGDSDSFVPRPWPKTVFQTALIEAAKSGGATWILYRGNEKGVSKVVRDAYQNYGDMEFGNKNLQTNVDDPNRHIKLINIAGKGKFHSEYDFETHAGVGDNFLLDFEKFVSEQEVSFFSQKMDINMPVPIAIIVCEGDIETIAHISEALENKLPVIIMKGSGKAADLVFDFLQNEEVLRKKASVLFGIRFDDTKYNELEKHLATIKKKKDLIGVFDLDQDDPLMLSNIVGEAVVSCWSMENILQRDINDVGMTKPQGMRPKTAIPHSNTNGSTIKGSSLAWKLLRRNSVNPEEDAINQILGGFKEGSRPYVLNPKYSTPTSLPLYFYFGYQLLQESGHMEECGPILLLEALKANRCDYVRVLLDQGVNLKMENLPELYEQTVSCQDCTFKDEDCLHMQWILKQIQETHAKKVCHKYRSIIKKMKEGGSNKYKKKIKELPGSVADAAKGLCRKILRYKEFNSGQSSQDENVSNVLLWAIFANRKELAEIYWLRGKDHLLTGLVCSAILKKLSKKANNVKEQILSNDLADHSKLFEQRCLRIMDRMYEENTKQAIDLMDTEADIWGIHSSPLTFAYENFMYDVVAHTCSQKNMNRQWYNNLAPDLKPFLKSAVSKPKKFFTAPLTKYVFNYMMFFTMLIMYSAFVLTSISTKYYVQDIARVFEYYVYFWGAGDFIEELISCFGCLEARGRSHRGYYSRMKRYLYDFWNVVDLLSYALLISALFVRHFYIDETFTIARRMFGLSLLVMYLRFLEVFLIHRKMGPTLIMIKEMLKDLLGFLFIALFVVLGVGIYYHANLWPDHQTIWSGDWTNWRIWTIIYYPYWQLYAELNLEHLDGSDQSDCTNITSIWESDTSINRCPQEDWTVQAVAAIYLLFSNLLLVNLVIAMFSFTFERVQENSEKLWRFERYTVINDYDWRIPSPINLVFLPYRFFCCPTRDDCCLQGCRGICCKDAVKNEKKFKADNEAYQKNFQKITALKIHNKI